MRSYLPIFVVLLAWAGAAHAQGLLVPQDQSVAPLALVKHRVTVAIEDQVATTDVEQTFQNPTDRALEATYLFPVPKGASVDRFAMWVDGKKVSGELLKADDARQTYTDIVRRAQDPGLLEYMDSSLMRLRVFPVPAHAKQKVSVRFSSVTPQDTGAIEYVCPLKADSKSAESLEEFSLTATIKSQHGVQNVYSPSHAVAINQVNDHEVKVGFEKGHVALDRDFRLFYSLGDKDVGLTALTYRPVSDEDGHFLLLLSPRVELAKKQSIPRDLVLVLDTSGSMQGVKMEQARKALKHCLARLRPQDRFAVLNFATVVDHYRDHLVEASPEQVGNAKKWVDKLQAAGSTAINDALLAALALRSEDSSRTFTVVFFTDGCPTVGECDCDKIVKNVLAHNSANTRIFTFGVGDDVNATLLDQLAEQTRAVSSFVRPAEDIEEKVSSLYAKISHPVLTDLKLTVGNGIHVSEIYPPHLPDLFHGGQVIVSGRYTGHGSATVTLTGNVGKQTKEFVFETTFPKKTGDEKAFVEQLWARRKVGYLLDQIRANGEKKELVDEVTVLAKKHGIATPYTSYLIAPDKAAQVAGPLGTGGASFTPGSASFTTDLATPLAPAVDLPATGGGALGSTVIYAPVPPGSAAVPMPSTSATSGRPAVVGQIQSAGRSGAYVNSADPTVLRGTANGQRRKSERLYAKGLNDEEEEEVENPSTNQPAQVMNVLNVARQALASGDREGYQAGQVGVELSLQSEALRNGSRPDQTTVRRIANGNCFFINGAWIDETFTAKIPTIEVKALSAAYFRILERHPEVKEVFQLGNRLIWVTPSGTALVIDAGTGQEKLSDCEIDKLFVAKK
jgi:Ca-activated chloride channel family protein